MCFVSILLFGLSGYYPFCEPQAVEEKGCSYIGHRIGTAYFTWKMSLTFNQTMRLNQYNNGRYLHQLFHCWWHSRLLSSSQKIQIFVIYIYIYIYICCCYGKIVILIITMVIVAIDAHMLQLKYILVAMVMQMLLPFSKFKYFSCLQTR